MLTAPRRAVFVEGGPLTPDRDGGSRANADILASLRDLGWAVEFRQVDAEDAGHLAATLRGPAWDLVIVSRPGPASRLLATIRDCPAPTIYLGHDLYFTRLRDRPGADPTSTRAMTVVERSCWEAFDLSLYPTTDEAEQVRAGVGADRAMSLPYFRAEPLPDVPLGERSGLIFVGSVAHEPNRVGLEWFVEQVWPSLRLQAPDTRLTLVGDWEAYRDIDGIEALGTVGDEELDDALSHARVAIAPLTFGAGMKAKVVRYAAAATPVVGTTAAWQGFPPDPLLTPHDDAADFATHVLRLLHDDEHWFAVQGAVQRLAAAFSGAAQREALVIAIEQARSVRAERRA